MKKLFKILIIIVISGILTISIGGIIIYNTNLSSVSNNTDIKLVEIKKGSIRDIANTLYEYNLIKNKKVFLLYTKLNNITNLKSGYYKLNESMTVKEIVNTLEEGSTYNPNEINITFREGLNIREYAKEVEANTTNSSEDFINTINNKEFVNSLIDKYWFLSSDIINDDIYYYLEGYLYPDTYTFSSIDVSVEDIIYKLLDEMDNKLTPYKEQIDNSSYSIHEILTLASIVELEAKDELSRKDVAGVFYNRLNSNWPLGSDVTVYYANKIDDWTYSLTYQELNNCNNSYNTRCSNFTSLPIGPIGNANIDTISAVLNPNTHDYYYFVADCSGKTYLSKTSTEHSNIIATLKNENNWCA